MGFISKRKILRWTNEEKEIINKIVKKYGYVNAKYLQQVFYYRSLESITKFLLRNKIPYVMSELPPPPDYKALEKFFKIKLK